MGDVIRFPAPPATRRQQDDRDRRATPGGQPLWREAAGRVLRQERQRADRTLGDVAGAAGISVQYLSEIERGLKEPSSEMLAAVTGALGLDLVALTAAVTRQLRGPVCLAA
ncbi:helix-turn-helix domain-containing protein [Nocardioides sp. SYSU DS0651]|uniref:helix-turn-helix domain-containing protein n=1 Tax=Nocardioides sp. SYSU DS0651 TaxID=3415955 RepID=UPI003F4B0912